MTLAYRDAYLAKFCTAEVEAIATADVAALGDFPTAWEEKLIVLRAYIVACLENQADADDLFAAKYKVYSREFEGVLAQARVAAAAAADETLPPLFSVPLERG